MLLADITSIALSVIGALASLQGLWLLARALWPARVEATATRSAQQPVRCFLVGLLTTAGVALVVALLGMGLGAVGQMAAFSLVMAYMVYLNVGVSGFVTHIGRRLPSPADLDQPWRATIRGGVALELAYLLPIPGWIGVFPISFLIGAGATTLTFVARKPRVTPVDGAMPRPPLPPPRPAWAEVPPVAYDRPAREPAEVSR